MKRLQAPGLVPAPRRTNRERDADAPPEHSRREPTDSRQRRNIPCQIHWSAARRSD